MTPCPRVRVNNRHPRHLRHRIRFLNRLRVTRSISQSSPVCRFCVTSQRGVFDFADFLVSSMLGGDGLGDGRVTINPRRCVTAKAPRYSGFLASATAGDEGDT